MRDRDDDFNPYLAPASLGEGWDEPTGHHTRYRICRAAMTVCAVGAGLMAADRVAWVVCYMARQVELSHFLLSPGWQWGVGSAIPWSLLLSSYLLMLVWAEPHWRRRSGLLLLLGLGGVASWTWQHA